MRHHQIEQDETDVGLALEDFERFTTVVSERDAKRALLELHLDDAADVRFVIGNEHVARSARSWTRDRSDESGDVFSIAAQLEEELADIRARRDENEQNRVVGESTETMARPLRCSSTAVSRSPRPMAPPNSSAATDDRRDSRRDVFGVESRVRVWLSISKPSRPSTMAASTPSR